MWPTDQTPKTEPRPTEGFTFNAEAHDKKLWADGFCHN